MSFYPKPKNPPAFDLTGDLTAIPTGYLVVACRRGTAKMDVLRAVADELTRRGVKHWAITTNGSTKCFACDKAAHYRIGQMAACPEHKDAVTDRRKIIANRINAESAYVGKDIEAAGRLRVRREAHHNAKGKKRQPWSNR